MKPQSLSNKVVAVSAAPELSGRYFLGSSMTNLADLLDPGCSGYKGQGLDSPQQADLARLQLWMKWLDWVR